MHPQSSKIPTDSSHAESERAERPHILTINGGSSSLKFALFALTDGLERLLSGRVERIGMPGTRLTVAESGRVQEDSEVETANQAAVVHGDDRFFRPELVTLGVSETGHDLRDVLASQDLDVRAAEAVALFCYRAKTWLGALAAARRSWYPRLRRRDRRELARDPAPHLRRAGVPGHFSGRTPQHRQRPAHLSEHARVAIRVIRTDDSC